VNEDERPNPRGRPLTGVLDAPASATGNDRSGGTAISPVPGRGQRAPPVPEPDATGAPNLASNRSTVIEVPLALLGPRDVT
jgi:hypothetical protein